MKTALRLAVIVALPLALAACNETTNGYDGYGRGGYSDRSGGGLFGSGGLFGGSDGYDDRRRYDDRRFGSRGGYGYDDRAYGYGGRSDAPYAYDGRCDDPRYTNAPGGRAAPGTDDYDCSRVGGGLMR